MKRLAILGASGHGRVVADAAELAGWKRVEFFDDAWPEWTANGRWPVLGNTEALLAQLGEFSGVVVAIGDNAVRRQKLAVIQGYGVVPAVVVHPAATVSPDARLASGTVVLANAVINIGAEVGPGCIINSAAVIEHDCRLADAVHVSPNASLAGGVVVGAESWIGMGACVRQLVQVGARAVVGMGAVVTKHLEDAVVVAGNPARPVSHQPEAPDR